MQVNPNKPPAQKKRRVTEGSLPNLYCPVQQPIPSADFTSTLLHQLKDISSDAQLTNLISTPAEITTSAFGPVPFGSPLSYQQKVTDSPQDIDNHQIKAFPNFPLPNLECNYSTVLTEHQSELYEGLATSHSLSKEIEEQTRKQSQNKLWLSVRKQRLTSSIFKDICSRRKDFTSLASRLKNTRNIQTEQMKYGLAKEPEAAKLYAEITGNSVFLCGFVVNPSAVHIGTSPDRRIYDPSSQDSYGLLEIKCPTKESYEDCDFLVKSKNNETFRLKTSHKYYYQVLGQLGITGLKWCDFFVMCKQNFHKERVYFHEAKWSEMKMSLDRFYFDYFLDVCS